MECNFRFLPMKNCYIPHCIVLVAVCFFLASCNSVDPAKSFAVRFQLDPALAGNSIQIDVIGVSSTADLPKWEYYSISDYWKAGDAMRRDATKVVMNFGPGQEPVQTLLINDKIWDNWLSTGADHLVIVAHLLGSSFVDRPGNADSRRLILPLNGKSWGKDTNEIQILVQASGLRLLNPKVH